MGGKLSKKARFRPLFKCKVIKLIKWSDLCVKLHQDERGWPSVRHRDEEPRDAGQGLPEGGGARAGGVLPGPGLPQHPPLLIQLPPVVHRVQADVRFPGQIPHSRSVVTNTIFQSFCFYYNLCIPKGFFTFFGTLIFDEVLATPPQSLSKQIIYINFDILQTENSWKKFVLMSKPVYQTSPTWSRVLRRPFL